MTIKIVDRRAKTGKKRKCRRRRSVWTRPWILRRNEQGASNNFLREVEEEDPVTYKNHLRLNSEQFDYLLSKVKTNIQKEDTILRPALPARLKLQIVMRYLATGDSFSSLESSFRVPKSSISKFLPSVLDAIYEALEEYIQVNKKKENITFFIIYFKNTN